MSTAAVSGQINEVGRRALSKGWRWLRLGEICEIQLGKMLSPKSKTGLESFPYLRNLNVQWGTFNLSDIAQMDFDEREREKFALRHGDLLVCEGGEPGRAAVWNAEIEPCFYQKALHRLRPLNGEVDPHFLMCRLWLGGLTGEFSDSHAKTTIAHLPAVRLKTLPIPLPKLSEQKRIARNVLDQIAVVQRARVAAEAQLQAADLLLARYMKSAFHEIVPLTVSRDHDPAPRGWRWILLTDAARLESGHTPSRYHPEWWGGDVPWLALPDIRALDGKTAYNTTEYTNEEGLANSSARLLPRSTVCMSRTASVGFVTIMGRPMATSQDFVNWVCGSQLHAPFLAFLLRAARRYILSLSSGAIHKTVYMPTVKAFRVCIPTLEEQVRIATVLETKQKTIESMRCALASGAEAIEKLPAAILRRAFNGEL